MLVTTGYGKAQAAGGGSCPHGSAPGACGACGGGGGGGGAVRKNPSGLMGWNQAWAVWNSIQVNKAHQTEYLKGSAQLNEQQQAQNFAATVRQMVATAIARFTQSILMPMAQGLNRTMAAIGTAMAGVGQGLSQMAGRVATVIQNALNGEILKNVAAQVLAVVERLATALGELRQRAEEWLEKNVEAIKTLLYKHLVKRLQNAVSFAGLKEFTGKVIQQVGGWLFDKFRGKNKKKQPANAFSLIDI